MYVRGSRLTITLSTVGTATAYTTVLNGLLYSVQTKALFAGASAAASKVHAFREKMGADTTTVGTTNLPIFKMVSPSSVMAEYFPRNTVMNTSKGSSGLRALTPLNNERIKTVVTTSSALAAKVLIVEYSLI